MMGRNHATSGVLTGALVAWAAHLDPGQATAFIAVTSVASLLPDFDHPSAMLPRVLGIPGQLVATFINRVFGHRTLTHSVLGVGVLGAALAFTPRLPTHCYWAVILGCVTHIVGDMLTVSGVPVFWPIRRVFRVGWMPSFSFRLAWPVAREIRVGRMRTNGPFERRVMTPLLALGALVSVGLVIAGA